MFINICVTVTRISYLENAFKKLSNTVIPLNALLPKARQLGTILDGIRRTDDAVKATGVSRVQFLSVWNIIVVAVVLFRLALVAVEILNIRKPPRLAFGEALDFNI